jgi:hypothetical protein
MAKIAVMVVIASMDIAFVAFAQMEAMVAHARKEMIARTSFVSKNLVQMVRMEVLVLNLPIV